MRILLLISIIFLQSACESNRFENWNEMKNKIMEQESEIESLKELVSKENDDYSQLKREINNLEKAINAKIEGSHKDIESQIFSIPFISQLDKIDLSRLMGKKIGLYEVELINVEELKFTKKDENLDFQLTLSTQLLNSNNVSQNGLVSYYQYSRPQKGIINSTSSRLVVNSQSPYVFLEGNELYQISGKLVLKISGKF